MKIEFRIEINDITRESLENALMTVFDYDGDDSPADDLWFYIELLSVLRKDLDYLRDMKRVMVRDIMHEVEDFKEDDFLPLCGDIDVTNYYGKKHFSELSKKAQNKYLELEDEEESLQSFLFGIDYHIVIRYMVRDDVF